MHQKSRRGLIGTAVAALALTGTGVAHPAEAAQPARAAQRPPSPLTTAVGRPTGAGDVFVTPTSSAPGFVNGAQIIDKRGRTVWFHRAAAGTVDADFRSQTLHGERVLTFWEGTGLGGLADGTDYVYDRHHKLIAKVHAGRHLTTDGHEFLLNDDGTAWVLSYDRSTADLSAIGGSDHQAVINGIVRKVDIRTGRVLFSWNSARHIRYSESYQPLPASADTPWDWFHVNAVHLDRGGRLLVDARNTWAAYRLDRHTGRVLWRLGGKRSTFRLTAARGQQLNRGGAIVAWQHDVNAVGANRYTFFDNESAGTANTGQDADSELDRSRTVTVRLFPKHHVARLVASNDQPDHLLASSQGNAQRLAKGRTFVGWGNLNEVSEFDRRGRLLWHARFPTGVNSYRAYLLPWKA
ncbi:hypothetical protein D9V37_16685 [Nocardioides mangrovicus]|uniref:ArsR family transcriptional regulator n=1 Tax=Nocardioides mangrovicus TaxID=2478913 RepID=A0A3L8NYY1_9ACTN|nr:arylsulfotransferase family protein [Nocardioides mangrovicus]RLV48380.1 hypothetical protein D9V37_16685 [Nocardioides mangrovicus]